MAKPLCYNYIVLKHQTEIANKAEGLYVKTICNLRNKAVTQVA
jgi:hypothetical protein